MGNMTPDAFSGFSSGCIGDITRSQVSNWTSDQVFLLLNITYVNSLNNYYY